MAEHRVSVLSASLRRFADPERTRDPRILTLLSDLRALQLAPPPRAHFRAELRSQLVAVAPRLVAEGVSVPPVRSAPATTAPTAVRARGARFAVGLARIHNISLGRPLAVLTAVVAVFAMLLGSAVWMSKKSLPGDALYSLKRANENVQLSLADGATAKSKDYLSFAGERVSEVQALLKRASAMASGSGFSASGAVSAHTASLISSTLDSADSDVRNAARLLGAQAVSQGSASPLTVMTAWAPGQITKLQGIADQVPAGSLHDRMMASAQLVVSALSRAHDLQALAGCTCLNSAASDALGPVPCQPCTTTPVAIVPTQPPARGPTAGTPTGGAPVGASTAPGANTPASVSSPRASPAGSSSSSRRSSSPAIPLPSITLPIHLPTLPSIHVPTPPPSATSGTSSCVLLVLGICVRL